MPEFDSTDTWSSFSGTNTPVLLWWIYGPALCRYEVHKIPKRRPYFEGGISAEQGERMIVVFRLAKMICTDGYRMQIKVLGGRMLQVTGMEEGDFVTEILEATVKTPFQACNMPPFGLATRPTKTSQALWPLGVR